MHRLARGGGRLGFVHHGLLPRPQGVRDAQRRPRGKTGGGRPRGGIPERGRHRSDPEDAHLHPPRHSWRPRAMRSVRSSLIFALSLGTTSLAFGVEAPPLQVASLGDFELESGETLLDAKLAYRTEGTLDAKKSNAIL